MSSNASVDDEGDHVECKQCTCLPPKPKHKNVAECHAGQRYLKNWERWVAKRKQVHEHLSKSLKRPPGDLLMNLDEDFRKIQEERLLFGYCKINTYFDKYRGNPAFWKLPAGLPEKSHKSRNPTYFSNMTKIEQNEIPLIKHVTVPKYIKKETNVSPCSRQLFPTHEAGKSTNIKILSSKINQIEPYLPECEEMIIIGQKLKPQEEKLHDNDDSLEYNDPTLQKEQELSKSSSEEINATPRICFVINETEIYGYNELENGVMKIRLLYECTTDRTPEVRYLRLKNIGRTALRFYWNPIEKFLLFRDLIKFDREESHSFYFNKNELLLAPEEVMNFPIWFKSNVAGNYFEMWEITTKPRMWDSNFKLILNLLSFVYPPNFEERSTYVKSMLDERIGNTVIRCCLNDILLQLKFKESDDDNFDFTEKQLFESANLEIWGIEKRPKYVYNREAVKQLKLLYEEVKMRRVPRQWNYCIRDLRMMTRKKDIWVYVENKTKEMLRGSMRRTELRINVPENVENLTPTTEKDIELEDVSETYCHRLDNILQGLERPCMIANTERSKYFTVFCILRNFSFKMSYALSKYENPTDHLPDDCYPCYEFRGINTIEQLPDRLLFEKFDDVWIDRVKINPQKNAPDTSVSPKPEYLKNISLGDYKLVYKLYFNTPDINEKGRKDKIFSKDDGEKSTKEPEKTTKGRRETPNVDQISTYMMTTKEFFDPFLEEFVPNIFEQESKPQLNERIQNMNKISFDYLRYLIVCTYLIEAVDAMVDALESFKENTLDIEVLGELTKCTDVNLTEFLPKEDRLSVSQEEYDLESGTPTLKIEEDPYFHNLLDSHLNKNLYTKEYIVEGKRKISREESVPPNCQESPASASLDSWAFKSHETVAESVKSKTSAQVQTSEVDDDFKDITDELLKTEVYLTSTGSTCSEKTQDVFYFMDAQEEVPKEEKPNM